MDQALITIIYLSAALFMGWSLGANDAANIFGTAVMTRMVSFRKAALAMTVFIALGAVISGSGPVETLGELGEIRAIDEAFMVSLTAAGTVLLMTSRGIPVSTSQSIVGAIVGWNLYSGNETDMAVLSRIAGTWVFAPVLGAGFGMMFYLIIRQFHSKLPIHLVQMDRLIRTMLLIAGILGSYSLGANNMANVMGVFVNSMSVPDLMAGGRILFTGRQLLFLLGALAVATGVWTYSHRVMDTVGTRIYQLSPASALAVVMASATVLFIFASTELEAFLLSAGLPSFPLVPVSQSQTVVGAVIGIGLLRGAQNLNLRVLARIFAGWILTPVTAMVLSFFLLSFT